MKNQPPDLTQFKSLAREVAEAAFAHDKELIESLDIEELANTQTALDEFEEVILELKIMVANLQLDIEIESIPNQEN